MKMRRDTILSKGLQIPGLLVVLFLFFRFGPLSSLANFSSIYLGGNRQDGGLSLWLMRERAANLFSMQGGMLFPYSLSGAYSDNFILPGLLYKTLSPLGLPDAALYNLIILSPVLLAGVICFLWFRRLSNNSAVALFLAICTTSFPYYLGHIGSPQLLGVCGVPLLLLSFEGFFSSEEGMKVLYANLIAASILLTFYWSVCYAVFLVLLLALLGLHAVLRLRISLRDACLLACTAIPYGLLLLVSAQPYLAVQARFGAPTLDDVQKVSTGAKGLLQVVYANRLWGTWFASPVDFENQNFPGALLLALFCISLLLAAKRNRNLFVVLLLLCASVLFDSLSFLIPAFAVYWYWAVFVVCVCYFLRSPQRTTLYYASLAMLFLVFSWGSPTHASPLTPFALLFEHLPGISAAGAPGRMILVFYFLALACMARSLSIFLEQYRPAQQFAACVILGCVLFFESQSRFVFAPMGAEPPPIYQTLATHVAQDVSVSLPILAQGDGIDRFVNSQTEYMLWQQSASPRYINGYSESMAQWSVLFPWRMRHFPSEQSLEVLNEVPQLRWLVYHADRDSIGELDKRLGQFPLRLNQVAQTADGARLLEVTPFYYKRENRIRIESAGGRDQRLHLELQLDPHSVSEQLGVGLDCRQSGGEQVEVVLTQAQPRARLHCLLRADKDMVSSKLASIQLSEVGSGVYLRSLRRELL